jgi:hypothetical protein
LMQRWLPFDPFTRAGNLITEPYRVVVVEEGCILHLRLVILLAAVLPHVEVPCFMACGSSRQQ